MAGPGPAATLRATKPALRFWRSKTLCSSAAALQVQAARVDLAQVLDDEDLDQLLQAGELPGLAQQLVI